MKKTILFALIAALLIGVAIYSIKIALAFLGVVILMWLFPKVLLWHLSRENEILARKREKRMKEVQERDARIEKIIREVPQERLS